MTAGLTRAALAGLLSVPLLLAGTAGAWSGDAAKRPDLPMVGIDQEFGVSDAFEVLDAALPDDHPSIRNLLMAYPGLNQLVCLAGCSGATTLVAAARQLQQPVAASPATRVAALTRPPAAAPAPRPASDADDGVPGLAAFPRIDTRFTWTNPTLALAEPAAATPPPREPLPASVPVERQAEPQATAPAPSDQEPSRAELRRQREAERRR